MKLILHANILEKTKIHYYSWIYFYLQTYQCEWIENCFWIRLRMKKHDFLKKSGTSTFPKQGSSPAYKNIVYYIMLIQYYLICIFSNMQSITVTFDWLDRSSNRCDWSVINLFNIVFSSSVMQIVLFRILEKNIEL